MSWEFGIGQWLIWNAKRIRVIEQIPCTPFFIFFLSQSKSQEPRSEQHLWDQNSGSNQESRWVNKGTMVWEWMCDTSGMWKVGVSIWLFSSRGFGSQVLGQDRKSYVRELKTQKPKGLCKGHFKYFSEPGRNLGILSNHHRLIL